MGDKKKAQGSDDKMARVRRPTGRRELTAILEKLTQKIKKCQSRQKGLEQLGKSQQRDSLTLARELRRVDRQSAVLLAQLQELMAGRLASELAPTRDSVVEAGIRESLEGCARRLDSHAQQAGEMKSRTQRLELLGQQAMRKTEALEHRVDSLARSLDRYEERLQTCVALPAEAMEAVVNGGRLDGPDEPASGGSSNVVALKRLQLAEQGGAGTSSAADREVLQKLRSRLETLEALAARLETLAETSSGTIETLRAGQDRLGDEVRQWVEQQQESSSLGDTMRAELDRRTAEDLQRDAALDGLKEITAEASRQSGLMVERLGTLEEATAELSQLNRNQQLDLRDLQLQAEVGAEHGRILAVKIDTLDTARAGLEETGDWQASQLGELGQEVRRLGGDTEALSGRTQGLTERLDETAGQAKVLEQRVLELETDAARLAEQHQRLEGESRRLANAHSRLSGGAAVLLLLLIGSIAAFWAARPKQDLDTFWQGEIASFRQALDHQAARVSAQDQGLADLQSRLAGQVEPTARFDELSTLIAAQSRGQANQQTLLAGYRQELVDTQGSLEQTAGAVERLAQEQQQLAQQLLGLRQRLAGAQPDRGPESPPLVSQQSGHDLPGGEWLAAQKPSHYTIQLVAAHAPRVIDDVAGSFTSSDPLAQYRRLHDGRDWYVLLYGSYPSFAQAREAIAALPEQIRSFGPWIRRFGSVQSDLMQP